MVKQAVFIVVIAMAVAAVLAFGFIDSDSNDEIEDTNNGDTGSIFTGPFVNNINMGFIEPVKGSYDVTDPDNHTITYRAVPREGFQFQYWEDSDGEYITDNPSMTFPAKENRTSTAVFTWGGPRSVEISWHMPIFDENGVSFGKETEKVSISISSFDWSRSINDDGIQRMSTIRTPSPVALLTDDGVIESIVTGLNGFTTGLSNMQKAMVVLAFVQDAIDYEQDINLFNTDEFWATPMESLYLGYGDCEDGAILFVSIASAMGIDCGFVTFDSDHAGNQGTGHMSVAIALDPGESISGDNVATFVVDGTTYAYGETAVDPALIDNMHPMFGVLGASYDISDGKWTRIIYNDGRFTAGSTLSIGNGEKSTGHIIYGSDVSQPPALNMTVGDSFKYSPSTSLPSEIRADGNGIVAEGGFLTWDSETNTLSGTADRTGTFVVTLMATSTVGPIQTAVQIITLIVEDSDSKINSDYYLIYGDGEWNVESSTSDTGNANEKENEKDLNFIFIIFGLFVIALIIIAWRVF